MRHIVLSCLKHKPRDRKSITRIHDLCQTFQNLIADTDQLVVE